MYEYVYECGAERRADLFDHERLRVYRSSIGFVAWVEGVNASAGARLAAVDHMQRASSSIPVNIAEASGKTSKRERCQFIDTAYGSALECAACLDVLLVRGKINAETVCEGKDSLVGIVAMLVGFRNASSRQVRENADVPYAGRRSAGTQMFSHEKLAVYQRSLDFVRWCDRFDGSPAASRSAASVLDRTSTGVVLNIAEGNGTFSSKDRCRFIGHSRTAALQAAAYLDVLCARDRGLEARVREGKGLLRQCVEMQVAWERSLSE